MTVSFIKAFHRDEIISDAKLCIKAAESVGTNLRIQDVVNAVFNTGGWERDSFELEKRQAIFEVIKEDILKITANSTVSVSLLDDDEIEMR